MSLFNLPSVFFKVFFCHREGAFLEHFAGDFLVVLLGLLIR